jgi:hypothetical protein
LKLTLVFSLLVSINSAAYWCEDNHYCGELGKHCVRFTKSNKDPDPDPVPETGTSTAQPAPARRSAAQRSAVCQGSKTAAPTQAHNVRAAQT